MSDKQFEFELFRLNIVDSDDGLFQKEFALLRKDSDILNVLKYATNSTFDRISDGRGKRYKWCLRHFNEYDLTNYGIGVVASLTLAKSTIIQSGSIVTEKGIEDGVSESDPPLADTIELFFFLKRHLVAVEYLSSINSSNLWRKELEDIISNSSCTLKFISKLVLEPRPENHEVIGAFKSFDTLTRLKVHLRLPNPELNRYTKSLYEDLVNSEIRDYIQDMRNTNGLSKDESARPFASVSMAQDGYKAEEVILEGYIGGQYIKLCTGSDAAHGKINQFKDFVRGLRANTKTKEAKNVLKAISDEINRIAPDSGPEGVS